MPESESHQNTVLDAPATMGLVRYDDPLSLGEREELKMWLAVRTDLSMSPGKLAIQSGHAFGALYCLEFGSAKMTEYLNSATPKIAVRVKSESELNRVLDVAHAVGISAYRVVDAGRSELEPGTPTVVAFGPARRSELPSFLRRLQLL